MKQNTFPIFYILCPYHSGYLIAKWLSKWALVQLNISIFGDIVGPMRFWDRQMYDTSSSFHEMLMVRPNFLIFVVFFKKPSFDFWAFYVILLWLRAHTYESHSLALELIQHTLSLAETDILLKALCIPIFLSIVCHCCCDWEPEYERGWAARAGGSSGGRGHELLKHLLDNVHYRVMAALQPILIMETAGECPRMPSTEDVGI